jgi:hypothetical protein
MSIIDQLFRLTISENVPQDVEDVIQQFSPNKDQVMKKRRMHRDLWFFKDHSSVRSHTSYWTYVSATDDMVREEAGGQGQVARRLGVSGIPISNGPSDMVYCDSYWLREGHSIFANSFITWKDDIYSDDDCFREAYERMLFDHDGENTYPFRILMSTSEYIPASQDQRNMGLFLGGGCRGDPDYTEHPQGITILNIISKACDGIYKAEWSCSGFDGDHTGDYENDLITIYNQEGERSVGEPGPFSVQVAVREYIEKAYKEWSEDPEGEFTGLIIGDFNEDELPNLIKETGRGEKFFSIFVKPDCNDIIGGYWGYKRDECLPDGTIVDGPRAAAQCWNRRLE